MIWPFNRKTTTETGAKYYVRDAAVADAKALVDFKHLAWRSIYRQLKGEEFFAQAEATTAQQVKYWQSRITKGDTVWIAEDLRDRIIGTIHATTKYSEQTQTFSTIYNLDGAKELRYFYLAETANTTVGQALIRQAVGDASAITWVAGDMSLVVESLVTTGFSELGEPVNPGQEPWQGVPQQAMVRA